MQIEVAVNKTSKYAVGESGDSAEVVERPKGGVTALMVDGQGSGRSAKIISNLVVSKAMSLVADGTRDGAVARATHDYLFALRDGKVSATLTMLSADLNSRTIVISRNSHCPVLVKQGDRIHVLADKVNPIGFHQFVKPVIHEISMEEETILLTFTDGILHAGRKYGRQLEMETLTKMLLEATAADVRQLAGQVFSLAMELEENRPGDDMTLLALGVNGNNNERTGRLHLTYPV
ncbi:PP2C family protein-serine/threonine phosphatase [Dethiobacter alkaliphilus]|uniref:PP2C family protein-serine/threonine phosphatase n=1 Tax=Dethiobacter alkaliphilus TaxID=427926 RepID=UPI002226E2A6|nr:PP2C family protein-serine/threonine phosphatase [Dethiobacter alkaliphilus]MCW3491279.1 serine/threonine-protein phosphatase [Dethiobacter alkaliphilus]